jgi:hypothetical protein
MQDHDRNRAIDQGRDSRGVFAGEQRPHGPCCSVGQDEPVGGGGDAVEPLGAHRPHNCGRLITQVLCSRSMDDLLQNAEDQRGGRHLNSGADRL